MKFAIFIALVLFGIANCAPADENALQKVNSSSSSREEDNPELINTLHTYFDETCKKKNVAGRNIAAIGLTIKECLKEHAPNAAKEIRNIKRLILSEKLCADSSKHLKIRMCFNEFNDLWKECADDEEKYIPDFFFDAVDNLYQFACVDDGANLLKMYEISTQECFKILKKNENTPSVCDDTIKESKINDNTTVQTKPLLCDGLISIKTCYSNFITKECRTDSNVKELFNGVVDAVMKTC